MKQKLIAGLAVVAVIIGGYIGFVKYEEYKFIEFANPHVKNTSLRLASSLRNETGAETTISFNELFTNYEADIAEIEKGILEVQMMATSGNQDKADPVLAYLTCSRELLRTLLSKNRKILAARNAGDLLGATEERLKESNYYNRDDAMRAYQEAKSGFAVAQRENQLSHPDIVLAIANLKRAYNKVLGILPANVLIDPSIIEAVAKNNNAKVG